MVLSVDKICCLKCMGLKTILGLVAAPRANEDAIGDTVPCNHNESCPSNEKICTPSSKGNAALQLPEQDDMFNVCHEPADTEPEHHRETVLADEDGSLSDIGPVVEEKPVMDDAPSMANPAHRFLLDSGASIHATGNLEVFSEGDFNSVESELQVMIADGRSLQIHGYGSVQFDRFKLLDVKYVPGLRTNTVSVLKLIELNYSVTFGGHHFEIRDATGVTIAKGSVRDKLPELWPAS